MLLDEVGTSSFLMIAPGPPAFGSGMYLSAATATGSNLLERNDVPWKRVCACIEGLVTAPLVGSTVVGCVGS